VLTLFYSLPSLQSPSQQTTPHPHPPWHPDTHVYVPPPTRADLWICLICGHVGCGRYRGSHAAGHWQESGHGYALELETQVVGWLWCRRVAGRVAVVFNKGGLCLSRARVCAGVGEAGG
jgi:hypothetical protein